MGRADERHGRDSERVAVFQNPGLAFGYLGLVAWKGEDPDFAAELAAYVYFNAIEARESAIAAADRD